MKYPQKLIEWKELGLNILEDLKYRNKGSIIFVTICTL